MGAIPLALYININKKGTDISEASLRVLAMLYRSLLVGGAALASVEAFSARPLLATNHAAAVVHSSPVMSMVPYVCFSEMLQVNCRM